MAEGLRVIRSGLAPTDRIVIDGLQRARPGPRSRPRTARSKPPRNKPPPGSHAGNREMRKSDNAVYAFLY